MTHAISTEILINARPEKVWDVLMDFEGHSSWNPFILSISGSPVVGDKIQVFLKPEGSKGMKFEPEVQIVERNKCFQWQGKLFVKGLFDGQHRFELEAVGEHQTRFIQSEKFGGILVGMLKKMLDNGTVQGFRKMNEALKKRVENN